MAAQIRKNYASHFVVGRIAGPSYKENGEDFYGAYDAQDLLIKHAKEIGIQVITSKLIVYALPKEEKDEMKGKYLTIDDVDEENEVNFQDTTKNVSKDNKFRMVYFSKS